MKNRNKFFDEERFVSLCLFFIVLIAFAFFIGAIIIQVNFVLPERKSYSETYNIASSYIKDTYDLDTIDYPDNRIKISNDRRFTNITTIGKDYNGKDHTIDVIMIDEVYTRGYEPAYDYIVKIYWFSDQLLLDKI